MTSFPSHGIFHQNILIYKPIMSADNKEKLKHSLLSRKPVVKVEEFS